MRRFLGLITLVLLVLPMPAAPVFADPPDISGQAGSDAYEIVGEQANQASETVPTGGATGDDPVAVPFVEYRWAIVCERVTAAPGSGTPDCGAAQVCADPNERLYRLWGRTETPPAWLPLSTRCFGAPPTAADTPRPTITPAMVLNEIRRIGLPRLEAKTQPEGKTLVNFATIFYTQPQPFTATVTLLGQQVDIQARPTQFTWNHGDGTTATTTSPGAPYPSKEITHHYADADATVRPRVDVTYTAQFRVNNGTWQDIPETLTIPGPPGTLRVTEATPVLSGNYS